MSTPQQAVPGTAQRIYRLVLNPWMIIGTLVAGAATGLALPDFAKRLDVVGSVYVDLLKMIVLPFMLSAVIFSLQRLFRDGGAGRVLGRVVTVFVVTSVAVAAIGIATSLVMRPGADLPRSTMETLGRIVGGNLAQSDTPMTLHGAEAEKKPLSVADIVLSIVPANIFAALATGDALKTLVFALLFGFAVSQVPARISAGLTDTLDTVYQACQTLMRWLNFPLPIVLFCMVASQLGATGLDPLKAMARFVVTLAVATLLVSIASIVVIWRRSGLPFGTVLTSMRAPLALAVATRSGPTCMPSMIESLSGNLAFSRTQTELLVPLSISLHRVGQLVYFVCATVFIAQLYGRSLGGVEMAVLLAAGILTAFASVGASGLVTVSLTGLTCGYLGLPFEAALVLFVAVEPVCDVLRTIVQVLGDMAAVALIAPRPVAEMGLS